MKNSKFLLLLAVFGIMLVVCGDAYAADSIFSTISEKMWKAVGGLRKIAYVLAGFGMVAFTFGAIFNKISWKHFGNIMISLFILSVMTPLIEYTVFGEKGTGKLTFANKYVARGNHSSVEQGDCKGADCQNPDRDENDCENNPSDAKCGKDCKDGEENVDGTCKPKCGEGQTRDGSGSCVEATNTEGQDGEEENSEEQTEEQAAEEEAKNDPCAELSGDKKERCANAKEKPEKPGACSAEEPKCEGGYQSKAEVCAGKEGKEKKSCEKDVDKHNKEVNKEYKAAEKEYEKEQKAIAKDKYEARKDNIAPGQEVNCEGLSSSQCSRLQSKQDRADEKQAKKDRKDEIEKNYQAAVTACHGDPDCEKQAKKDRNKAKNEMNRDNFNNAMQKTQKAAAEARTRLNDAKTFVGSAAGAVNSISTGVNTITKNVNTIKSASDYVSGVINDPNAGFLDKVGATLHGASTISSASGNIVGGAGNAVGNTSSYLGRGANAMQDLTSSSSQRDQNRTDRSNGQSTNAFSSITNDIAEGAYTAGQTGSTLGYEASNTAKGAGEVVTQGKSTQNAAEGLLNSIDKAKGMGK